MPPASPTPALSLPPHLSSTCRSLTPVSSHTFPTCWSHLKGWSIKGTYSSSPPPPPPCLTPSLIFNVIFLFLLWHLCLSSSSSSIVYSSIVPFPSLHLRLQPPSPPPPPYLLLKYRPPRLNQQIWILLVFSFVSSVINKQSTKKWILSNLFYGIYFLKEVMKLFNKLTFT